MASSHGASQQNVSNPGTTVWSAPEPVAQVDPRTLDPLSAYLVDAAQRSILYWDVLRQRGNQYREHMAQQAPNVLQFDAELVLDGRTLARPVNYGLVRITPPEGVTVDLRKRPFVVIDPRAGHGPGIGGFKPTARSASPWPPAIPAISSASCPTRCPARRSRM